MSAPTRPMILLRAVRGSGASAPRSSREGGPGSTTARCAATASEDGIGDAVRSQGASQAHVGTVGEAGLHGTGRGREHVDPGRSQLPVQALAWQRLCGVSDHFLRQRSMPGQPGRHYDVDVEPVAHRIVTSWPPGTFVENLALLPDGGFVVSLHNRPSPGPFRHVWRSRARRRGLVTESQCFCVRELRGFVLDAGLIASGRREAK